LLCASPAPPAADLTGTPDVFTLQDFRWMPVVVRRTPTEIDCHFDVVTGAPTVHLELLSEADFEQFSRSRRYETIATTRPAASGGFQRMLETTGKYRVLILNDPGAPPVAVSLMIRTDVDPQNATLSGSVPLRRQFFVIGFSLVFFFGTVVWSGGKLLSAWRRRGPSR
jgi:hypothetical protein